MNHVKPFVASIFNIFVLVNNPLWVFIEIKIKFLSVVNVFFMKIITLMNEALGVSIKDCFCLFTRCDRKVTGLVPQKIYFKPKLHTKSW